MIRVGICDDNITQANLIREVTERSLFKRTEYKIEHFSSGEEVIRSFENNEFSIDLLLLDIHMQQMDGLQTAEYIRKNRIDVDIIFVTVSEKYVYEGYMYKAYSYILKQSLKERLEIELERYIDEKERVSDCLQISINGTIEKLQLDKVYYFESNARKITAYTNHGQTVFYNKLDTLELLIKKKGFIRCHQSYMVNDRYVSSISRECIVVNYNKIPVSRKYYERMKQEGKFDK